MAKRRRSGGKSGRAGAAPTPGQSGDPTQAVKSSALFGGLRLAALLSATVCALAVFGLLQGPLGYWPALLVGLVGGVLARAVLLWVEQVWLRALVRRARARQGEQGRKGA